MCDFKSITPLIPTTSLLARLIIVATRSCGVQERHVYVKLSAEEPLGSAEVVIPQMSLADCSHTCDENLDSLGKNFSCAAFDYSHADRRCLLSSSVAFRREEPVLPGKAEDLHKAVKDLFFGKLKKPEEKSGLNPLKSDKSGFYWKLCMPGATNSLITPDGRHPH